jgi:YD repeat-containing protein
MKAYKIQHKDHPPFLYEVGKTYPREKLGYSPTVYKTVQSAFQEISFDLPVHELEILKIEIPEDSPQTPGTFAFTPAELFVERTIPLESIDGIVLNHNGIAYFDIEDKWLVTNQDGNILYYVCEDNPESSVECEWEDGNYIHVKIGDNTEWWNTYDNQGNLVESISKRGEHSISRFDIAGHEIYREDEDSMKIFCEYDLQNKLVRRRTFESRGGLVDEVETFEYPDKNTTVVHGKNFRRTETRDESDKIIGIKNEKLDDDGNVVDDKNYEFSHYGDAFTVSRISD